MYCCFQHVQMHLYILHLPTRSASIDVASGAQEMEVLNFHAHISPAEVVRRQRVYASHHMRRMFVEALSPRRQFGQHYELDDPVCHRGSCARRAASCALLHCFELRTRNPRIPHGIMNLARPQFTSTALFATLA